MQTQRSKRDCLIRHLRLMNNLTQKQLSYKAKIDKVHLKEIENGTRPCSELTARRLSCFFGYAYEWEQFVTKEIEDD